MVFKWEDFIHPEHENLKPFERADYSQYVNLSNNEFSHPELTNLITEFGKTYDWSRVSHYPSWNSTIEKLKESYTISSDSILLTAGTDLAISHILAFFSWKHKKLIIQHPNFFRYEDYARAYGLALKNIDFFGQEEISFIEKMEKELRVHKSSLVVVTTPHVYSGGCLSTKTIEHLALVSLKHNHILIIDEAYQAFCKQDFLYLIKEYPNVILLRSFSKSLGIPGLRIGAVFSSPPLIHFLKKTGMSSSISHPALSLLTFLLSKYEEINKIRNAFCETREWFSHMLQEMFPQWKVLPSRTNFVTFFTTSLEEATSIKTRLEEEKILIKNLENIDGFKNALRITISSHVIMKKILEVLSTMTKN